jgi:hypothetical protein
MMRSVRRGLADIDEAMNHATFIVRTCWPEIIILGRHLRTHHHLTFPEVSALLDLKNSRCIYDENDRPDTRYGS